MDSDQRSFRLLARMRAELRQLVTFTSSDRPWQMPLAAALCVGTPLLLGVFFDQMDAALTTSLGCMVLLSLPRTPMLHRMAVLMACSFGMTACYALGLVSQWGHSVRYVLVGVMTTLVALLLRYFRLGPPGAVFFVMAAAMGSYSHTGIMQIPMRIGLFFLGGMLACVIAFFYTWAILRARTPLPVQQVPHAISASLVTDSVIIGTFVGLSLACAELLHLQRSYWVAVSCVIVIQGTSLQAVWTKQLHRIVGTALGLLLTFLLLNLPLTPWSVPLLVMGLMFVVESAILRHYGFAVAFITPLTILLIEVTRLEQGELPQVVMQARFLDTILGCLVGFVGGLALHSARVRTVLASGLHRLALCKVNS